MFKFSQVLHVKLEKGNLGSFPAAYNQTEKILVFLSNT